MDTASEMIAHEVLDVVPAIMRTIRAEMRSRRGADLSVPQFRALFFLQRNPGASLSTVAEHLGLTSPTVCKMIDGMVSHQLVTRRTSSTDRRKVILTLTVEGRTILEKARSGTQARLMEVLASLTPDDRDSVHHVMQLLHPLFSPAVSTSVDSKR